MLMATKDTPLDRSLRLMTALAQTPEGGRLEDVARALGLPLSTAYRLAGTLERHQLLTRSAAGHYGAGPALVAMSEHISQRDFRIRTARPILQQLAQRFQATAHMGMMEGDMLTYHIKAHGGGPALFTREGEQLEAYCSAIGRVLLAHMPQGEQEAYLAAGPFIPLTARTITDPAHLRTMLRAIPTQGFATDDEEIAEGLNCIAVPVENAQQQIVAAISLSFANRPQLQRGRVVAALHKAARAIRSKWS